VAAIGVLLLINNAKPPDAVAAYRAAACEYFDSANVDDQDPELYEDVVRLRQELVAAGVLGEYQISTPITSVDYAQVGELRARIRRAIASDDCAWSAELHQIWQEDIEDSTELPLTIIVWASPEQYPPLKERIQDIVAEIAGIDDVTSEAEH